MANTRLGGIKGIVAKMGMTFEQYMAEVENGNKWCTGCKQWLLRDFFGKDKTRGDGLDSRCINCRRVKTKRQRNSLAPSSNIRQNAAYAVATAIDKGHLVIPSDLPCFYCGKTAVLYHHHLGYARSHFLDVQAVCKSCHTKIHWGTPI